MGIIFATLAGNKTFQEFTNSHTLLRRFLVPVLFMTGWFFLSFPSREPQWSPWFNFLTIDLIGIFPTGVAVFNLFRQSIYIGISMILMAILLSSTFQKILCFRPLLWLGELSLPIYLVHGPLLRSVFCWMVYSFTTYPEYIEEINEDGNIVQSIVLLAQPSPTRLAIALPCYLLITLYTASLWNRIVEPRCVNFARNLEQVCMRQKELLISSKDSNEKLEPYS
jgi:peptidoglycan/LPS O-acetylase OafA/YrhL